MPHATIAVFRQVDPPGRNPGYCYEAALYLDDQGHLTRPVAIAWLSDYTEFPAPASELGVVLDYLLVPDHDRGEGHGGRLLRACYRRWPNLWPTERLPRAVAPDGVAQSAL